MLTVHDPRGYPPSVKGKRLANRLQSLDGKTIFLVVNTKIIKPRESWVDDPEMRAKIEADGHAAILGVGL